MANLIHVYTLEITKAMMMTAYIVMHFIAVIGLQQVAQINGTLYVNLWNNGLEDGISILKLLLIR